MCAWSSRQRGPSSPAPVGSGPGFGSCNAPTVFDLALDATDAVLRAVEAEVIPRMVRRHPRQALQQAANAPATGAMFTEAQVTLFTQHLLAGDEVALSMLQQWVDQGLDPAGLCLELLSPAARLLGDWWSDDLCDFTQVTMGLGRLHGMLRLVANRLPPQPGPAGMPRQVLFSPGPGEQHTLGLCMVADFFRASGWDVWPEMPGQVDTLLALVGQRMFHLVGFSIGQSRHVGDLARLITQVRAVSADRQIAVMVGGPLLLADPGCLAALGADAMATDARQAMLAAERLVTAQGRIG